MANETLHFRTNDFDDLVLRSKVPVLVDFWAAWCGPCRAVAPAIDAVAVEFAGRARVGKVNVDESRELAQRFNIRTIPTLIVFHEGAAVEQVSGALPKEQIAALLERYAGRRDLA